MEERKRKREEEKTKAKMGADKKKADKQKELELELQALKQQKDHAESKKKTMEHRKNFRDKIRREEELKRFKEEQEEQMKIDYKEEQRYAKEAIKDEVDEEIEDDITQEELDFLEEYSKREQAEENIKIHVEEPKEELPDPMEEKIFKAQVKALATGRNKETTKLFEKITDNYDNKKSITDNLNAMASEIKELIKNNTKQIKKNEKVVVKETKKKKVNHFEVEQVPIEQVKEEQKYKSKLNNLMRLR